MGLHPQPGPSLAFFINFNQAATLSAQPLPLLEVCQLLPVEKHPPTGLSFLLHQQSSRPGREDIWVPSGHMEDAVHGSRDTTAVPLIARVL